jgi:hypothetical protein
MSGVPTNWEGLSNLEKAKYFAGVGSASMVNYLLRNEIGVSDVDRRKLYSEGFMVTAHGNLKPLEIRQTAKKHAAEILLPVEGESADTHYQRLVVGEM